MELSENKERCVSAPTLFVYYYYKPKCARP